MRQILLLMILQFDDRVDAAMRLTDYLLKYKDDNVTILVPPNGSVVLGHYIAQKLGATIDLLVAGPIYNPLRAAEILGIVSLDDAVVNEGVQVTESYLMQLIPTLRRHLLQKYSLLTGKAQPAGIEGRTIIVVAEGVATGRKLLPTLTVIRDMQPLKLIVATPVMATEVHAKITRVADELVCLFTPMPFYNTAYFYYNFPPVNDEEIASLLSSN